MENRFYEISEYESNESDIIIIALHFDDGLFCIFNCENYDLHNIIREKVSIK